MAESGFDGSRDRLPGGHADAGWPRPRRRHQLRFADGGCLELGRRTAVMAILNVTPDSFSDGGRHTDPEVALSVASRWLEEGADLIDVGGESTRPGADAVDTEEEIRRVLPVVSAIKRRCNVRVSIDTRKTEVARRAFDAGADLVNDVSALADPAMLPWLCEAGLPVVLMHMRGRPETMQDDTHYDDVTASVVEFLVQRTTRAVAAGMADDKIVVDPGIGFGKSGDGNLTILKNLSTLGTVGMPILVGASRKRFVGAVLGLPVDQRLEGSLAVAAVASAQGAHIVRSHDVAATVRTVRMIDAIRDA